MSDVMDVYQSVYELVDLIKESPIYLAYQESLKVFDDVDVQVLIRKQKECHERFLEYHLDEDLATLRKLKAEVKNHQGLANYYDKLSKMDDLLYELSKTMFKDVSSQLKISRYQF